MSPLLTSSIGSSPRKRPFRRARPGYGVRLRRFLRPLLQPVLVTRRSSSYPGPVEGNTLVRAAHERRQPARPQWHCEHGEVLGEAGLSLRIEPDKANRGLIERGYGEGMSAALRVSLHRAQAVDKGRAVDEVEDGDDHDRNDGAEVGDTFGRHVREDVDLCAPSFLFPRSRCIVAGGYTRMATSAHVRGRQEANAASPAQASREIHAHAQTFVGFFFFFRVLSPTLFYSIPYSALSTREQANLTTQRAGRVGAGVLRRRGRAAGRSAAYTEGYRATSRGRRWGPKRRRATSPSSKKN
ncbi:hypothetical protein B0H16DRAFT_381289 [Mycena metata]|uniref:Uncharacterized protein n=1 Tax=Mycena metata TaxID=1033252 RepID=A0AAD7MKC8_9AGAR|nr:hypothetical protein B0H16DRAFT_381289 [Mycena metata]